MIISMLTISLAREQSFWSTKNKTFFSSWLAFVSWEHFSVSPVLEHISEGDFNIDFSGESELLAAVFHSTEWFKFCLTLLFQQPSTLKASISRSILEMQSLGSFSRLPETEPAFKKMDGDLAPR